MSSTDSAVATGVLVLEGVWLHRSDDPQGTAVHLRYGRAARTGTIEVASSSTYYAGRTFPVVDFGANESEEISVRADVPFGPSHVSDLEDLRAVVRSRVPQVFRDNRGRSLSGVVRDYREQDAETGAQVTFTVGRVEA